MALALPDYLLDQNGIDQTGSEWPRVLANWHWLLPKEFTLWFVSRFADLFIVLEDGSVHMLDVGAGSLMRLADSRDDFRQKIDEGDSADDWLMIPLVNELAAAGIHLQPGQCYGFKLPPVLGGEYSIQNVGPLKLTDYLGAYGSIHLQLLDVPDGQQVTLKVINQPDHR